MFSKCWFNSVLGYSIPQENKLKLPHWVLQRVIQTHPSCFRDDMFMDASQSTLLHWAKAPGPSERKCTDRMAQNLRDTTVLLNTLLPRALPPIVLAECLRTSLVSQPCHLALSFLSPGFEEPWNAGRYKTTCFIPWQNQSNWHSLVHLLLVSGGEKAQVFPHSISGKTLQFYGSVWDLSFVVSGENCWQKYPETSPACVTGRCTEIRGQETSLSRVVVTHSFLWCYETMPKRSLKDFGAYGEKTGTEESSSLAS